MACSLRDTLRTDALVPTVYRSPCLGVSTLGSRCATTRISFSSVPSAASTAAMEFGLPTANGMGRNGNSALFFSGSTGSVVPIFFSAMLSRLSRRLHG